VAVQGTAAADFDYSFRLLDVAAAPAISLGTIVSGHLNQGLEAALYRLAVTPGQLLEYDGIQGTARTQRFDVNAGNGSTLNTDGENGPTFVAAPGAI